MSEFIGIDVGGTTVKGARYDQEDEVLAELTAITPVDPDDIVATVLSVAADLRSPRTVAAGVVVPGVVDPVHGIAVYAANLGWHDVPLGRLVSEHLDLPVILEHDVSAAALAEAGAAAGDLLFVALGTGIAGVHVVDGEPVRGASGRAGEIGHIPIYPDGEPCVCGQRGCLEAYASAAAISRRYRAAGGAPLTAAQVAAARGTDRLARAVWNQAAEALAIALATVTLLLDPGRVVLGGGLAQAGDELLLPVLAGLTDRLAWRPPPPLSIGVLGLEAGRLGAAHLARRIVDEERALA